MGETEEADNLGSLYASVAGADPDYAFRLASTEVMREQTNLAHVRPNDPLLNLVCVYDEGFDFPDMDAFRHRIQEHIEPAPMTNSIYYLLGLYVELLKQEQSRPLFLPRRSLPGRDSLSA